jgi:hypothetical protein
MKIPGKAELGITGAVSEKDKQVLLRETPPYYISVCLEKPIQLKGHDFTFIVLPVKLTPENQFQQDGRDVVLCQTQAEADESRELLTAGKGDMVVFQAGNLGGVAFATNLRAIITEHSAGIMSLPGGKKVWMAREREIDKATGKSTVKRKQATANEADARRIAQQWLAEYNAEKKKHFDSLAKSNALPTAPPRCEPLTETDRGDAAKAQMEVLRRQWKHCFELFDKRKAGCHFSEDDCRKAYLLDLAEQGENPLVAKLPANPDKEFFTQLTKAGNRAESGNKKLLLQLVDYLIAFNWLLGWCYLSDKELAEKISGIVKHTFTPAQINKRRQRLGPPENPGLVAKHKPGPAEKSP